jgi:hypothetical protein
MPRQACWARRLVSGFRLVAGLPPAGGGKQNLNDQNGGSPPQGDRGDLASYLLFLGQAYRF